MDVVVFLPIWLFVSGLILAIHLTVSFNRSAALEARSYVKPPPLPHGAIDSRA